MLELSGETGTLLQLAIVAALFLAARLLAWRLEPKLEARLRAIESPNHRALRLAVVLLRRLGLVIFVLLSSIALVVMRSYGWPGADFLVEAAMLLAAAWLILRLLSQMIKSKPLGKAVSIGVWIYVALLVLGLMDDAAVLLEAIGFTIGTFRLSLLLIVKMVVFVGVLLWVAIGLGNFIDRRLQASEDLTPSLAVLIGKIAKIVLIVAATLMGLSGLGIDLTVFAVFSGAIGVGIGFGLQKVVSNFISGIIILMDRSIKPGDTITLGETFGWIRELRARFVSVVTRDGKEYLIPNEDFITHEVINWSFTDALVRLDVDFGVSYDSDPHQVSALAIEAAAGCRRVYGGKRPVCWLTGFGDSSLDFRLRFWIDDPRDGLTNIRGTVLLALWDTLKEHGVGIPFPHREVLIRTPIEITGSGGSDA